ncbi:hypothetical protein LHJ74_08060 [Streptomyces sp. N2-109]|uniref:Uncharacterized protein n=1 Tax=Streptomyces gossypii TaxID=2883101 RepID=A0ABT2JPQ9_9ACTN|nr:hypothetical protein [Streptomyces gossypii]MCT2589867.1 hypothetical protein [Streptomyces gossypii]
MDHKRAAAAFAAVLIAGGTASAASAADTSAPTTGTPTSALSGMWHEATRGETVSRQDDTTAKERPKRVRLRIANIPLGV